jgi:CheY-like chemotaxis protein
VAEARDLEDTRHLSILLVEDSEDSRLLVQTYLKKTPYALDFAENGQEAVEKFKGGKYDIVLMDTQMPVMDGSAATRAIRAWETEKGLRPTPIVALTAHALREDAQRSLEDGCDAHLTKPVKKAKLLATIVEHTSTVLVEEDVPVESELADGRIVVRVDAEIEDLIPHYLENRRKEVCLLQDGLNRGDYQFLRSAGHTMKGTGGGYGFEVISDIGRELEKAGTEEDAEAVGRCIDRLADYLKKVDVVIE